MVDSTELAVDSPLENDWIYRFLPSIAGGLNTATTGKDIDDDESLVATNLRDFRSRLEIDLGYKTFGVAVVGTPRATFQFFLTDGSQHLTLITNSTFYRWDTTAEEWQYVGDGATEALVNTEVVTDTVMEVVSTTGFAATDRIGITMDDGTQHQTTIASIVVDTSITLDDGLPSTATAGNAIVRAAHLNGVDIEGVSITVLAFQNWMVFANGVDAPQRFDGSTVEDVPNLPSGLTTCKVVVTFQTYLILMHTTESGTIFPQRFRWSNAGDPTTWTTSDFTNFVETEDQIVTAAPLGPFLITYKERALIRTEFIGTAERTWRHEQVITAEGALSVDSVVDLGDFHIFVGNANFYKYSGGFDLVPLGDKIFTDLFGFSGQLNPNTRSELFSFYVEELDEIWTFYPAGDTADPDRMLRYLVSEDKWFFREYPHTLMGFGFYRAQSGATWTGTPGTWEEHLETWNAQVLQTSGPTTQLCGKSPNQVYEYDYITADDDGTAIDFEVQTKDFYVPNKQLRFDRFELFARGTGLLEYSIDEGNSWIGIGTFTHGSTFTRARFFKQFIGRKIRFRITGTGTGFSIEWLGFKMRPETVWEYN